ncbi:Uncharacterised protein [Streptococcus pneumoniae]|nr:Uncharacterised protein [Streptococcus pneumoniae]VMZ92930.1 Uncharacterised protein [Streptococcus pneumoniae]VOO48476.1 Uncharacterised protein [Streptococcus pneumoniae]
MSNIKYIGNDTKVSENGKIHIQVGNKTKCGAVINDNPQDWKPTPDPVTCQKPGCK